MDFAPCQQLWDGGAHAARESSKMSLLIKLRPQSDTHLLRTFNIHHMKERKKFKI